MMKLSYNKKISIIKFRTKREKNIYKSIKNGIVPLEHKNIFSTPEYLEI